VDAMEVYIHVCYMTQREIERQMVGRLQTEIASETREW